MTERMADAFAEVAERSYPIYAVVFGAADADPLRATTMLLREAIPADGGAPRRPDQCPFAEKCWKSVGPGQVPPQRQPARPNARTSAPPA